MRERHLRSLALLAAVVSTACGDRVGITDDDASGGTSGHDEDTSAPALPDLGIDAGTISRLTLIACGTSYYACLVAKYWLEKIARLPVEVDIASEFRYRDHIIDERTLVVSVCQSGETADTLAAMEAAQAAGSPQITLSNYEGTQTTRIADSTILIRAGLEIGVAASKTFICSMTDLYLLSLHLGQRRGVIDRDRLHESIQELARLPDMVGSLLGSDAAYVKLSSPIDTSSSSKVLDGNV